MKYLILIISIIFCFSCDKKKNSLDSELRNKILEYQNQFPLSSKSNSTFPFYAIVFRKKHTDTLFYIGRSEASSKEQYNQYDVFEDEKLKPSIIFDFNSLSKKIIKVYPNKNHTHLLKSPVLKNSNPINWYQIRNGKIYFLEKNNY